MKLDMICKEIYIVASNEAKIHGHEYVTPEHFLYCTIMFDFGKDLIRDLGGDIKGIKKDLCEYFDTMLTKKSNQNQTDSFLLIQMFELATVQATEVNRATVSLFNIISSMFNLHDSYARYYLEKNGVDKNKVLQSSLKVYSESESEIKEGDDDEFLKKYTVNLTEKAKNNMLDPLIGREDIVNRTIQVLCRRLKNNPLHVGETGIGKTAIVEGIAQKIVDRKVPETLLEASIFYIDMGAVVAGTKYRGDFEERLIKLLDIISKCKKPIIYLDEINSTMGLGSVSGGGMDATSIFKQYLSNGDVKFIGQSTYDDYKKHLEKNKSLLRRFQKIEIGEPTIEECFEIIKGIKSKYEEFHNVIYTDEIIKLTCKLTAKYIQDKFLPDKAIDVIDEVGSYVRMNSKDGYKIALTEKDIERCVAHMAKIPENSISENEIEVLKNLEENIKKKIFGQDEAITTVVDAIKLSRSGLNDGIKPVASLLFVGPTGVGKTEIAKQLSENLNIELKRFDMSEYQEKHSVSRLIGSPPGYAGYEEGGLLTDCIRRTPHCVLLLDEIEKAHPDIYNVLLQVMDYGMLTDNIGKKADFKNVILIMTSNAGAKDLGKRIVGFDEKRVSSDSMTKEVEKVFSPEFRNRLDNIVLFKNIDDSMAKSIAEKAIDMLSKRLQDKDIDISATQKAIDYISSKGKSETFGAREIIRIVDKEIKKELVNEVLFGKLSKGGKAVVDYKKEKITVKITEKKLSCKSKCRTM